MAQAKREAQALEAFCTTCPTPEEVTNMVQALGFELTFQMEAVISPAYLHIPPLPAQYHYRDRLGDEIVFLAGYDADPNGERLPPHASRFWTYSGRDAAAYRWITHALATRWAWTWHRPATSSSKRHVA